VRSLEHTLPGTTAGTVRKLLTLHYGERTASNPRKAYLQASLHADEWPPMLVMHHLRKRLAMLEAAGQVRGEIVLVPFANPIGLAQRVLGAGMGRFDLGEGRNFNRGFPQLAEAARERLADGLNSSPQANRERVREVLRELAAAQPATSEVAALKRLLLMQAIDADIVLDLHCDSEAVVHLYVGTPLAEQGRLLAACLGARALLTSRDSGDDPFDEAVSRPWWELREAAGSEIAPAGFAATVELRGQTEISHALAQADAEGLLHFLALQGLLVLEPRPTPAHAPCEATPLEGVEPLVAPTSGLVVFAKEVGDSVHAGETVLELIDPDSTRVTPVTATYGGLLYARSSHRFAMAGTRLAKIAGTTPFRRGLLLSE
jgi:predicted deacylase